MDRRDLSTVRFHKWFFERSALVEGVRFSVSSEMKTLPRRPAPPIAQSNDWRMLQPTVVMLLIALVTGGCIRDDAKNPPVIPTSPAEDSAADTIARSSPASSDIPVKIERIATTHLPNSVRIHAKVISGGLPEGDAAFAELEQLGIKTVISVDGSKPDVLAAQRHGMRYVHLPHGYDGVPLERAKQLAKAIRDLPGPFYIHCHQGKHRSPAASAVACIGAGFITHEAARELLKVAGTGENYRGLFQSVGQATPLDASILDRLPAEFPATSEVPPLAEAMVGIEHLYDHLKLIEKAGWKSPSDHPALAPQHEALLLRENFEELLRTTELKDRGPKFEQLANDAHSFCLELERQLAQPTVDVVAASRHFATITANCKKCHEQYRDVPDTSKP
jgi:hypothetical protein